jgi:hypothetical protein
MAYFYYNDFDQNSASRILHRKIVSPFTKQSSLDDIIFVELIIRTHEETNNFVFHLQYSGELNQLI